MLKPYRNWVVLVGVLLVLVFTNRPAEAARYAEPGAFAADHPVVQPLSDGTIVAEAEEFRTDEQRWSPQRWGENYYAATLANTFLSRKAYLAAPEGGPRCVAERTVRVNKAGKYLAMVRYEAAYRFETRFTLQVFQEGKPVLDRMYGARDNLKIWAFGKKLQKEAKWDWGVGESIVWEGHDAFVDLKEGPVLLRLIAADQPAPKAKRNVDVVMLTMDVEGVKKRIETEQYLPLDGFLTQAGDVWVRIGNRGQTKLTVNSLPFKEHSPYWVHQRNWKPVRIELGIGETSDWVEVGSTMDSLNDGQWGLEGNGPFHVEFGNRSGGEIVAFKEFDADSKLLLAVDANTRYSRRIRKQEDVLYELLHVLRLEEKMGVAPKRTPIYGTTFEKGLGLAYDAGVDEFRKLFDTSDADGGRRGYIDVRGVPTDKLEDYCKKLGKRAADIAVVSLGDEIGIAPPDGIATIKKRTDILRKHLPNAGIGANFSPHHGGARHTYLPNVYQWVTCFREDAMTMPWTEDYIFQVPVGSQQMNNITLDMLRAGIRGKPDRKIHNYVMPHYPGNTPDSWRRNFYGALGHGMKVVNLFEFRPVTAAYTENHVTGLEMYRMVLRSFRELGKFEDIIQDGRVRPATTALWFSETGDRNDDNAPPFAANKRALYTAIRHQQLPLDFVVEQDALDGTLDQYQLLYLTDAHVSQAASKKIAAWVMAGGRLFATAGAGMFDENNKPNEVLRELLGVELIGMETPADSQVEFIKQDLAFAKVIDRVKVAWDPKVWNIPVVGARAKLKFNAGEVMATFDDGSPAVVRRKKAGKGETLAAGFLPGLSYYQPAIPMRPVDRSSAADSFAHFIPTEFERGAGDLIGLLDDGKRRPVACSDPLVEANVIDSPRGMAVILVNWRGKRINNLEVMIRGTGRVDLERVYVASGGVPKMLNAGDDLTVTMDLDAADAVILQK